MGREDEFFLSTTTFLFLDFDGVLRRIGSPLYKLERELLANLKILLEKDPGLKVVITSSWREVFSLEQLRSNFPEGVRARIIGTTPRSKIPTEHQRYKEVLAYLKGHGQSDASWLAIDDDPDHYPVRAPVLLVDPSEGLSRRVVAEILKTNEVQLTGTRPID